MERRLGRGLGALLGGEGGIPTGDDQGSESRELRTVAIERVDPNPDQPRKVFASEAMESLRKSIVQHGLLQPVCVRVQGDRYRIVAGERRWRASRLAGLAEIPVHREQEPGEWFAYVRVIELAAGETPIEELLVELPRVTPNTSRLDALMQLNVATAPIAVVVDGNRTVGLVHYRQLTEQLFEWQAPA